MLAESGEGKFFGSWGEENGNVVAENTGENLEGRVNYCLEVLLRMIAVNTMTMVMGNKIQ